MQAFALATAIALLGIGMLLNVAVLAFFALHCFRMQWRLRSRRRYATTAPMLAAAPR